MDICRALDRHRLLGIMLGIIMGILWFYMPLLLFLATIALAVFLYAVMLDYRIGVYSAIGAMAIIPHALWNNLYGVAIIFVTFISYVIFAARNGNKLNLKQFDVAFVVFMITVVLGFVTSVIPRDSAKVFLFFVTAFLFTILIMQMVNNKKELQRILITMLILASITSLYGIWQAVTGVEIDLAQVDININQGMPGRIFSTMENSNNFAQYLLLVIPIGISLVFTARGWLRKLIFAGLTLLPIMCLGLTYSRSGWIGFVLALGILLVLKNWKLIPLYIAMGCVAFVLLPQSILNRIYTIGNLRDTSVSYRLYIWSGAIRMLKDHWVNGIGIGPEVFSVVYSNYRDIRVTNATHAHMLLLELWLELGIAGLLSFVWMLGRGTKKALRSIFLKQDSYLNNILIALIASIAGIMGAGVFEYAWFYPRIFFFFWVIIGLMFSTLNISQQSKVTDCDARI